MTTGIIGYSAAFPRLRLRAEAYRAAWGGCSAKGLVRKPFCAYDEDPITLAIAAARMALDRSAVDPSQIGALFVGATTLPYAEKPASATIVRALFGTSDIRTVEITGSRQAGVQALVSAGEYVAAHPGKLALAIATDAPDAPVDTPYEHGLASAAAAFVVGSGDGIATIGIDAAVTLETFGSRFRRHGEAQITDLELRVDDDGKSLDALKSLLDAGGTDRLALAAAPSIESRAIKLFGGNADGLWPELGDTGAAGPLVALAHCLDGGSAGERLMAIGIGGGATCIALRMAEPSGTPVIAVRDLLTAGIEVDYFAYLKHKRVLSSAQERKR